MHACVCCVVLYVCVCVRVCVCMLRSHVIIYTHLHRRSACKPCYVHCVSCSRAVSRACTVTQRTYAMSGKKILDVATLLCSRRVQQETLLRSSECDPMLRIEPCCCVVLCFRTALCRFTVCTLPYTFVPTQGAYTGAYFRVTQSRTSSAPFFVSDFGFVVLWRVPQDGLEKSQGHFKVETRGAELRFMKRSE